MKGTNLIPGATLLSFVALTAAFLTSPAFAQGQGKAKNGTTLAGYKTLDICTVNENTWRYSGEISIWNEGAIDTAGLAILDCIENKVGSDPFTCEIYPSIDLDPAVIPAGTTQLTATTYAYSVEGAPLDGTIRNNVKITITNHSGHLTEDFGPNPKVTYFGDVPPPECEQECGCSYTQGYWKTHPEYWPEGLDPASTFFLATKKVCIANCGGNPNDDVFQDPAPPASWADVWATEPSQSQGYYQLAHQYMATVLNVANGACIPDGVQETLDLASAWLSGNSPSVCTAASSCGLQKDWAKVLDDYNNGNYPGGPMHCEEE